ncbi:hypothetical protein ONS95_009140 [Cadophora gregata]|uniref:uncharacterized protein n=1 Tax=Cadophora gregata TaxID=51156 RepID=UPI0026DAFF9F|nr:uncharacterized protein ONS95_009140 [Cadophora gregata]KAK0124157.1 hypothetical protein ONS95_009140 [Cadophora gregata]KAK0130486.1 hypothetical protein ONS96_001005 [Cadophora gregata f. sp. sojae]
MPLQYLDALVVGTGFGGIYQLKMLRDQGLKVKAIDKASDVGGTWYWNRYPGAMSDTYSLLYRFSWDHQDLMEYPWNTQYLQGPDILKYLQHVVKRHDLRKDMQFETEMQSAEWNESEGRWIVGLSTGETWSVKYLVTGLGLLSKTNFPAIPNLEKFEGELYHSANWPRDADLKGKRVGVIGNGSTGVQLITAIAQQDEVKELLCFQRNPQYTVPAGNGKLSQQERQEINENYQEIWEKAKQSYFAFGFDETSRPTFSVSPEEREKIYEEAWRIGNGFRFMFWTFGDIAVDEKANVEAQDFIKKKIRQIVKDPEKARKLCPTELYARRPLCDSGYYEQFNRDNVDIVDIKTNPITELTPVGVKTADGKVYELDVLICATGFDAVDGNYTRIAIKGREGESLKDHWSAIGPTSYLGIMVPNFPNLFMILGPNGPFANLPPAIEAQVEIISDLIARTEQSTSAKATRQKNEVNGANGAHANGSTKGEKPIRGVIEAEREAEDNWTQRCEKLSASSLFRKVDSWVFGKNIPGKKKAVMFYFGGLGPYIKEASGLVEDMKGFRIS